MIALLEPFQIKKWTSEKDEIKSAYKFLLEWINKYVDQGKLKRAIITYKNLKDLKYTVLDACKKIKNLEIIISEPEPSDYKKDKPIYVTQEEIIPNAIIFDYKEHPLSLINIIADGTLRIFEEGQRFVFIEQAHREGDQYSVWFINPSFIFALYEIRARKYKRNSKLLE